jgi:hypothetical protein
MMLVNIYRMFQSKKCLKGWQEVQWPMRKPKEAYYTEYKTRGVTYEISKHGSMTQKIKSQG